MPASGNTSTNTTSTTQRKTAATSRTDSAKIREGLTKVRNGSVSYARQTAERSVDVPVEVVDAVMPGVVSIPHGWGHDLAGVQMAVAEGLTLVYVLCQYQSGPEDQSDALVAGSMSNWWVSCTSRWGRRFRSR